MMSLYESLCEMLNLFAFNLHLFLPKESVFSDLLSCGDSQDSAQNALQTTRRL